MDLDDIQRQVEQGQQEMKEMRAWVRRFGDSAFTPAAMFAMVEQCNRSMLSLVQYLKEKNGHYSEPNQE